MNYFFIAQIRIRDEKAYQKYLDKASAVFNKYRGEYLAVDNGPEVLEGKWDYSRCVLIRFESRDDFNAWYNSDEYRSILKHRLEGAECDSILVAGSKGSPHIDHIALWTNDLEKLRDFYSEHLGCRVSERYDNPKKRFSSYFLSFRNGARIEIMKRSDITEASDGERTGLAHFAITVGAAAEVDRLTKKLEEEGVRIYSYPRTTGDGYYESVILDPDGNRVELTSNERGE